MNKVVCVVVFLFISTLGCTNKKHVKEDKSLNVALTTEVSTLDPVNSYDNVSGMIIYNVCEQLFEYHYLNRPYELRPLLAESMPKIENQGKRYIIKIKKNIRYHDHKAFKGIPRFLKAEDFVTSFKRLAFKPLNSTGWWLADGFIEGINEFRNTVGDDKDKFKLTPISGVQATDDHTLVIELTSPSPQFIYKLAMSFISPIPLEILDEDDNLLSTMPIGTGPYIITKNEPNKEVLLTRNVHYHDNTYPTGGDRYANSRGLLKDAGETIPFLDAINFYVIQDNQTRWNLFNDYKLDFIVLPQEFYGRVFDDVGNLKEEIKQKDIRLQTMPTLTFWWLSFNMNDPVLGKNLNLRKAIAHAIDMDRYIREFTNNTGQRANSILPPGIAGYNPSATLPFEYNIEKAKKFLALAGYPEGKGLPEIIYDTRAESKISNAQSVFFQEQLAQIGIKLKVVKNNFRQYLEKSRTGHLQFFQDGWTLDYPDAENILQILTSSNMPPGPNVTFYNNPKFDVMYDKLAYLPDGAAKSELITEMEKMVNDDLPWIAQYYSRNFILYHDYLKNYRPSDLIWSYPKYMRVK